MAPVNIMISVEENIITTAIKLVECVPQETEPMEPTELMELIRPVAMAREDTMENINTKKDMKPMEKTKQKNMSEAGIKVTKKATIKAIMDKVIIRI